MLRFLQQVFQQGARRRRGADHYANAVAGDLARGRQGHADNARALNAA
jgi:hypothetical protein